MLLSSYIHRLCLISMVLFGTAGCSYFFGDEGMFPSRSNDYLKAKESPPLEVPDHIEYKVNNEQYSIPELQFANVLPQYYVVPRVMPLEEVSGKGTVKVQTFQGDQWILIQRAPSQVWPLVIRFLQSNDVPLALTRAEQGLLQTGWLSVADVQEQTFPDERYRFILSPGVQANTTEVLVKQQAATDEGTELNGDDWIKSSNVSRQENMVTLLAEYLAGSPEQSSHSLLAQGIGSASRISMRYYESGEPYLSLDMPFNRGWASLGLALPKSGFDVEDLNRSEGRYYVEANFDRKKQKERGLIARLLGTGKKNKRVQLQDKYFVYLKEQGENLHISISRQSGAALQANEQAFMLRRLLVKLT